LKKIEIGAGCNIAWDVCIMDSDYHKFNNQTEEIKAIKIEDYVWIGCRSIISGNPAGVLKKGIYWIT
jgi:acetyltransferase-like isoleucine patch superfamily enzyme